LQTNCGFYCVVCSSGVFGLITPRYLNCLLHLIIKAFTPKTSAYYKCAQKPAELSVSVCICLCSELRRYWFLSEYLLCNLFECVWRVF